MGNDDFILQRKIGLTVCEFHGWITLQDVHRKNVNPNIDSSESCFEEKVQRLKDDVTNADLGMAHVEVLNLSGYAVLMFHAHVNRRRGEAIEMLELVKKVVREFNGATGLIYEFDEQTRMAGGLGVYTVMVIQNGEIEYRLDPFLSPAERTLESG